MTLRERRQPPAIGELDRQLYAEGYRLVCGIDEVGRGALAGPVVAAAVILPLPCEIQGLGDSKRLTAAARERVAAQVRAAAVAFAVGSASESEIEALNILRATFLAMERAVAALSVAPDLLVVDGNQTTPMELPQRAIIRGDSLCAAVAAASNVAKVHRTARMRDYASAYPGYGFEDHDGYGTRAHLEALERLGPCPIHRRSFLHQNDRQLSLF